MEMNKAIYKTLYQKEDYLLIDCCLTSGEQYFNYTHDENKITKNTSH